MSDWETYLISSQRFDAFWGFIWHRFSVSSVSEPIQSPVLPSIKKIALSLSVKCCGVIALRITTGSFLPYMQTPDEFDLKFIRRARHAYINDSDYKGFSYDAAWLVALALDRIAKKLGPNIFLDNLPFGNKTFSDIMKDSLQSTEFLGVTVSAWLVLHCTVQSLQTQVRFTSIKNVRILKVKAWTFYSDH